MTNAWIGVGGAIVTALLAFLFGRWNLSRANVVEREEGLRRQRLEAYVEFCASVVEYRRAQLHRWFVGRDLAPGDRPEVAARKVEEQRPEVAEDVRSARAAAWSSFYRILMISNDAGVVGQARTTLHLTREMKWSKTSEQLDARSDDVHDALEQFARLSGATLLADQPLPLAPPTNIDTHGPGA